MQLSFPSGATADKKHRGFQTPKWANFKPKSHPKPLSKTQVSSFFPDQISTQHHCPVFVRLPLKEGRFKLEMRNKSLPVNLGTWHSFPREAEAASSLEVSFPSGNSVRNEALKWIHFTCLLWCIFQHFSFYHNFCKDLSCDQFGLSHFHLLCSSLIILLPKHLFFLLGNRNSLIWRSHSNCSSLALQIKMTLNEQCIPTIQPMLPVQFSVRNDNIISVSLCFFPDLISWRERQFPKLLFQSQLGTHPPSWCAASRVKGTLL